MDWQMIIGWAIGLGVFSLFAYWIRGKIRASQAKDRTGTGSGTRPGGQKK